MTVVNPKSISGINSITTGSGSDNLLTIHTSDASSTERVRINSSGDVIVGSGITVSPDGDIFATGVCTATTFSGAISGTTGNFSSNVDVAGELTVAETIAHTGDTNNKISFPSADTIALTTSGSEAIRVDSAGRLLVNTNSSQTAYGLHHQFQVEGTNGASSSASFTRNSNDSNPPYVTLAKSRGTSAGSNTIIQNGDYIGVLSFNAADGTNRDHMVAQIHAHCDATPGENDVPGRLVFYTTADGANSSTERLRIDSSGRLGIQGAATRALLDVRASGGSSTMLTAVFGANEGQTGGSLSDNADKAARVGSYHYDTDEEPFGVFVASGSSGTNNLTFGGGTSLMNAATAVSLYTAANSTTTNGTKRLEVNSSGNVTVNTGNLIIGTSGKGIDFSATSDGSGTDSSELLDDYEEGSWTPTILSSGSSVTINYAHQKGSYTKVGRMIRLTFYVSWPSIAGSPTGYFDMGGLPYAAGNSGTQNLQITTGSMMHDSINVAQGSNLVPYISDLASTLSFYASASGAGWVRQSLDSSYHQGGSIIGGITYFTAT